MKSDWCVEVGNSKLGSPGFERCEPITCGIYDGGFLGTRKGRGVREVRRWEGGGGGLEHHVQVGV